MPQLQDTSFDRLIANADEMHRSRCVAVLYLLGKSCGQEIDQAKARAALIEAEYENPGPWEATWHSRLAQVGREMGLVVNLSQETYSTAKNTSQKVMPWVTFVSDEDHLGYWVVMEGNKAGIAPIDRNGSMQWVNESQVRKILNLESKDTDGEVIPWAIVQRQFPYQQLQEAPKEEEEHHGPSPFVRLLSLFSQDRNDFWVVVLFAFGVGIFSLATPIAVEAIVSTVQGGTRILLQPVIALSLVLLVFLGLAALLRVFKAFVVEYLQQRIFVRLVIDLANRLPRVRIEAMDRAHGPELVNRFFDVLTVQKASSILLLDGVSVVLQTAIGLMVLAFFNPYLLGFDLVLISAIAFIIFVLGRGAIRTSIKESLAKYDVAGWLEEIARHPLTFRNTESRNYCLHRANHLAGSYVKARRSHFRILFRQILFALILQAVASAALFGIGGWLVINRSLTLGQLVAAELILTMIVGSFLKLGKSLESYYDLMAGVDKLGHLIDLPLEKVSGERLFVKNTPATLKVKNLRFSYPDSSKQELFHGLNFGINPGERIAIVGSHGSGKSTLFDLIYGLRNASQGSIELDGEEIGDLSPESLRGQVSLIKGREIFQGTIAENVSVGRPLSLAQVRDALEIVGLLDEIRDFPDGLHTELSTGGVPLSRGQLCRLKMARAIAAKPRLLLIDELFDDLHDNIREKVLQVFLDRDAPWTLLVTTNRGDIVELCDRQINLDDC